MIIRSRIPHLNQRLPVLELALGGHDLHGRIRSVSAELHYDTNHILGHLRVGVFGMHRETRQPAAIGQHLVSAQAHRGHKGFAEHPRGRVILQSGQVGRVDTFVRGAARQGAHEEWFKHFDGPSAIGRSLYT